MAFLSGKCQNCLGELFADVRGEVSCQLMVQAGRKNPIVVKLALWKLSSFSSQWDPLWCLGPSEKTCEGLHCSRSHLGWASQWELVPKKNQWTYTALVINTSRKSPVPETRSDRKPEDRFVSSFVSLCSWESMPLSLSQLFALNLLIILGMKLIKCSVSPVLSGLLTFYSRNQRAVWEELGEKRDT